MMISYFGIIRELALTVGKYLDDKDNWIISEWPGEKAIYKLKKISLTANYRDWYRYGIFSAKIGDQDIAFSFAEKKYLWKKVELLIIYLKNNEEKKALEYLCS